MRKCFAAKSAAFQTGWASAFNVTGWAKPPAVPQELLRSYSNFNAELRNGALRYAQGTLATKPD